MCSLCLVVCVTTWVVLGDNVVSAVRNKHGTVTMTLDSTKKVSNRHDTSGLTQVSFLLEPDNRLNMAASLHTLL